jgi:hypothetical protein
MNIDRIIARIAAQQAQADSVALPKASTKRIKSKGEALREYHSQNYYLYFCFHDKTLFEPCSACKRSKREAQRNLSNL